MHWYKIIITIHLFSNENSTFKYIFFLEEITISLMIVVARLYFLLGVGVVVVGVVVVVVVWWCRWWCRWWWNRK